MLVSSYPSPSWNLNFCGNLFKHEIEELALLMFALVHVYLSLTFPNARVWLLISSRLFSVSCFFNVISASTNLIYFIPANFI